MIGAFFLALGDLGDRRVLGVLARSLLVTLLVFAAIGFALAFVLRGFDPCALVSAQSCPLGGSASGFGALLLTALALWFLFPAVAVGVVAAYMDRVIAAVERRHYPASLTTARPLGWAGGAWLGLASSLRVLVYNAVALPFYLVLLVTGVGPLLLFLIVNGAAFGHDLGAMVAWRHLDRSERRAWMASTRSARWLTGVAISALFLVPFVNLLAPILGAAMATHLFHRSR